MDDDVICLFMGLILGFFLGIIIGVKSCNDVEDMGGPGKYCYPNLTCDGDLTCVRLTNRPAVCTATKDMVPLVPEVEKSP